MSRRPPWSDEMSDGSTFIGPFLRLVGDRDPPEFAAASLQHDRDYYERVKTRAKADLDFLNAMLTAASQAQDVDRKINLTKRARLRYAIVRKIGWLWWIT